MLSNIFSIFIDTILSGITATPEPHSKFRLVLHFVDLSRDLVDIR